MAAFWLLDLLYYLFHTFTSPHPTLLSIFSNGFLVLQNSNCFIIIILICLPISADNPEAFAEKCSSTLRVESLTHTHTHTHTHTLTLCPSHGSDKKAGKHNSKS
ncbi:unnamed protein product [Pipistrellus nathusii]|uniref:Secreted protein n=1 Tax=Pipistrellus nathusii TaxID=59473 RepID=A0ABN9ZWJ1_PIPNA